MPASFGCDTRQPDRGGHRAMISDFIDKRSRSPSGRIGTPLAL